MENELQANAANPMEGFLFLLPNLLGFLIFFAFPLALSFYYSFTDYNLFQPPNFVGLQNYITALGFNIRPGGLPGRHGAGRDFLHGPR